MPDLYRLPRTIVVVSAVLLPISCGARRDEPNVSTPVVAAVAAEVSPEQQPYFDDGVVTLDEYQAAFDAFRTCAVARNKEVDETNRDPASGVIMYATSEELLDTTSGDSNDTTTCYVRHFMATEIEFQQTDSAALDAASSQQLRDFEQLLAPCLTENGFEIPLDLRAGSQAYEELSAEFNRLALAGKCEGVTAVPVR